MRTLTAASLALILVGTTLFVASSGAFTSMTADRGISVGVADDGEALLGLEYANNDRNVELESADSDGGGGCFLGFCADYQYDNEEIVVFTDNTLSGELDIVESDITEQGDDILRGDGIRMDDTAEGISIVLGDFGCSSSGIFGAGSQQASELVITINVVATNGEVTIDAERQFTIECLPD